LHQVIDICRIRQVVQELLLARLHIV